MKKARNSSTGTQKQLALIKAMSGKLFAAAVKKSFGVSLIEVEKQFQESRPKGRQKRTTLLEQYRLGKIAPFINRKSGQIRSEMVAWLLSRDPTLRRFASHPIWRVLSYKCTLIDAREVAWESGLNLGPKLLTPGGALLPGVKYSRRKQLSWEDSIELILVERDVDTRITAFTALLRESILTDNQSAFDLIKAALRRCLLDASNDPIWEAIAIEFVYYLNKFVCELEPAHAYRISEKRRSEHAIGIRILEQLEIDERRRQQAPRDHECKDGLAHYLHQVGNRFGAKSSPKR